MGNLPPLKLPRLTADKNFQALDPFDGRYYDGETAQYLSEESRIAYQAYIEAALADTLADFGICSRKVADDIIAASRKVTGKEVDTEEQTTRHDIKAVVNTIKKYLNDEAKPYVHFGATSYDIITAATMLQLRDATQQVVIPRLKALIKILCELTKKYAATPQIGRTHGQHAVPITFGLAMSEYVSRLGRSTEALQALSDSLEAKFSGAVGAYNALSTFVDDPLAFEAALLKKAGLTPAEFSNQIVPPEGIIRLIDELVIAAGIMANLGHDMRHLQRTEIAEIRERFEKGQTGSSTMAHKRNPWNFENVVSMHKQILGQAVSANLNIASEHQRDLTDSAAARFYPLAIAGVASMAKRLSNVMSKLEVDEEAMQRNLRMTGGAIAAEPLYLLLAKHGHTTAHEAAKRMSQDALETQTPLADYVQSDAEGKQYWSKFTDRERGIIAQPESYYTGKAEQKARHIAKRWST